MSRIFSVLAVLSIVLMSANLLVGLTGGDYNAASQTLRQRQREWAASRAAVPRDPKAVEQSRQALDQAIDDFAPMRKRTTLHILLGVLAALVAILVQCITVTYFIGTGRWCKEVVETYQLDERHIERSKLLKRLTFPWALTGMIVVMMIIALGAAADPGNMLENTERWVAPHFVLALSGTAAVMMCLSVQARNISANHMVINKILAEVRDERLKRGLEV